MRNKMYWVGAAWLLGLLWGCQLEDPQVGLATEELITLSLSDTVLLADGVSVLRMTATLGPEATANQLVTFATEAGSIEAAGQAGATLSVRASGRVAEAVLVSSTEVNARVTVSASVSAMEANETFDFQSFGTVSFDRALPDELRLSLADRNLFSEVGSETTVTARLLRSRGQVSGGTRLFFQVEAAPGDSVSLDIDPFVFADTDQASVTVTNLDTISGQAIIRAWIFDANGDTALREQIALPIIE